jgi:TolB protein
MTFLRPILLVFAFAAVAFAQQQIGVDIYGNQAASAVRLALPAPEVGAEVSFETIRAQFFGVLQADLLHAESYAIIPLAPNAVSVESAKAAGATYLLRTNVAVEAGEYVIEARLLDATGALQIGKKYRGPESALRKIAHTLASDVHTHFTGKPGVFLTQIAFVSNRDGKKEIWLMDYDGANQRRITTHNNLAITPDWSSDNERLVYTAFGKDTSDLYIINRRGGGRVKIATRVGLNVSPAFAPDGRDIAFVGSVAGNPDIYLIRDDGSNLRRLTSQNSIESTPSWSPTGRQIAFTSSRNGTPQIYVMDAEGTNIRRISFDGDWNDDAVWSPDGDLLAYTSRVDGRFQIRIMNLATQQSTIIAGAGSNEHPSWAPDGRSLVFMSNRSGRWQIYRVNVDGTNLQPLTGGLAENSAPDWSPK